MDIYIYIYERQWVLFSILQSVEMSEEHKKLHEKMMMFSTEPSQPAPFSLPGRETHPPPHYLEGEFQLTMETPDGSSRDSMYAAYL